jgi:hypothetical protein
MSPLSNAALTLFLGCCAVVPPFLLGRWSIATGPCRACETRTRLAADRARHNSEAAAALVPAPPGQNVESFARARAAAAGHPAGEDRVPNLTQALLLEARRDGARSLRRYPSRPPADLSELDRRDGLGTGLRHMPGRGWV